LRRFDASMAGNLKPPANLNVLRIRLKNDIRRKAGAQRVMNQNLERIGERCDKLWVTIRLLLRCCRGVSAREHDEAGDIALLATSE
jgi:hypothetical protein